MGAGNGIGSGVPSNGWVVYSGKTIVSTVDGWPKTSWGVVKVVYPGQTITTRMDVFTGRDTPILPVSITDQRGGVDDPWVSETPDFVAEQKPAFYNDAGQWLYNVNTTFVTVQFNIPTDAEPGVYTGSVIAHLLSDTSGPGFHTTASVGQSYLFTVSQ